MIYEIGFIFLSKGRVLRTDLQSTSMKSPSRKLAIKKLEKGAGTQTVLTASENNSRN